MDNVITRMHTDIFPRKIGVKIGLLAAAFLFAYIPAISLLAKTWLDVSFYSHGFLIPFVSLYFVWVNREKLTDLPIKPNKLGGLILIFIGVFMLLTGYVGNVTIIQQFSIAPIIPGLVLMLLGARYLKALSFPLIYLILMFPLLDLITNKIYWPFQLITAKFAGATLLYLGIPVFQSMQYIELPNITLEVAELCSGINFLISILAIGIPLAYFTQKKLWRRIGLVVFGCITAVLINVVRVILIGIWAYNGGEGVHGPLHILHGFAISVVGFIFLFICAFAFIENPSSSVIKSNIEKKWLVTPINLSQFNEAWLITMIILLSIGGYLFLHNPKPVPLKSNIKELSLTIGDWKGKDVGLLEEPLRIQNADSEIARIYRKPSGAEVKLYVAYFEFQDQNKKLIQNWLKLYREAEEIEIPISSHDPLMINKGVFNNGTQDYPALFWYNLNGQIVANRYKAKYITALDSLIQNRTNGALIIVYSDPKHSDDPQKVLNDEIEFTREIIPILYDYLPYRSEL